MKVTIFGSTGKLGLCLVEELTSRGHKVKALARSPEKIKNKNIETVQGDALVQADVNEAVKDADVVIVTLGHYPRMDTCSQAQKNINNAIGKSTRLIVVTSLGCGESWNDLSLFTSLFCRFVISKQIADKNLQEDEVVKCENEWTIVRPGGLGDGTKTGKCTANERGIGGGFVNRADVALFIAEKCLEGTEYLRKKVTVVS